MKELSQKKVTPNSGSLYVVSDIAEGELFTVENSKSSRPGFGMAPKLLNEIIGKMAAKDLEKGTALKPDPIR